MAFNWDDISINTETPETFFGKRHIKHERVYYDLMSSRNIPIKLHQKLKVNDENNGNDPNGVKAIQDSNIDEINNMCKKQLKISTKSNCIESQVASSEVLKPKKMLPPARPKAYEYAEIYKKRKEIKATAAVSNVVQPPIFKSKPLPTFYRSIKTATSAKPNAVNAPPIKAASKTATNVKPSRPTVPITPMVLKRSTNKTKIQIKK